MDKALIYCRISKADNEIGVRDQEALCRAEAERRGYAVVEVLTDNDRSAYGAALRPGYERLLTLLPEVDVVLTRHNDRLHRDVAEYGAFVRAIRKHKVTVVAVLGGDWAVETASGRLSGNMLAAIGEYESALRSERVNQALLRRARAGLPAHTARRALGFEEDGITHREEEVALIRKAAQDLLEGRTSLTRVARAFGMTTSGAKLCLLSSRMVGVRVFQGQEFPAVWEPVLDRPTQDALVVALNVRQQPERGRVHLLSGLCRCASCEAVMKVSKSHGRLVYRCPAGVGHTCPRKVQKQVELVDHYVTQVVLEAVSELGERPVGAPGGPDPELLAQVRKVEERLGDLERRISGEVESPMPLEKLEAAYAAGMRALRDLQGEVEKALPGARVELPGEWPWGERMEEWEDWWWAEGRGVAERRAVVESQVGAVMLHPGRTFRREDVEVVPA